MSEAETTLPKIPKWENFDETMEQAANLLEVSAEVLAEFFRNNLEEVLEEGGRVLSSQVKEGLSEGDYRSVDVLMEVRNGAELSSKMTCTFDAHYYRGYIKRLAKPNENGELRPLTNIKLSKMHMPKGSRIPRFKQIAQIDIRKT